ncbi:MAG TPA: PAS domain S-box protein [Chloroflexota bacterium]|nr:PAS domain S-box protein [Chloroflexota bacterium]
MATKLFDSTAIRDTEEALNFIENVLESSTEYSMIHKDLSGTILLWNEGARRIYGYEPDEVIGRANSDILHVPEDVMAGRPREIMEAALRDGKWEGTLNRMRKNGQRFTARVVLTPRRDQTGVPIGFLLISKDVSNEIQLTEELRAAQFYTRSLIESHIDALMTTDPLGIITDVNRQMCEMTGYERETLIGTPFKTYFTEPDRAEDGIRQVLADERVSNFELVMRSRDGHETVVSYNAAVFRDADGRLKGVFAAAREITDQKQLEENLRQVQNYTRGLIEASVDALLTVDPQFQITDVNEQTVRITGYSRDELIGSYFPDFFTDAEAATAGVRQTLEEGFVTNYVLVLRAKSGAESAVSFNASVFKDPDGAVRGIFASARDITQQMRLEEELRQAQNYTRGLIESSVDPMITVDQDLMITDVNEQMVKLTEVPKQNLIGSRFDSYFTEPAYAAAGVRQTLNQGFVTNYELTLRTHGGREVLVSFNASIFRDPEGNVRGIFAVARDVTDQRGLEEQLRESENYSRGLIEASVDALVTVNPERIITDVNEQMVRLTGYNRQQLIGSPFAGYFTDPVRAEAGVRETFENGVVTNYELVLRSRAGAELAVSFNASVFRDISGAVAGIFAAARDITDQKRLEQELREQQAYNRGLIESNIDALMTTDTLGIITDVNRQMCAVTGREREELVGTPFKEYFTDPQRAEDGIRRVLTEGRVTNYELTIAAADGKQTVVSYNATTFTGEDGRLRGVFAAARDITDQKRLEQQLREQQAYNRGLIESSVDAMLTVDPDLTITDVNEQMVRLTGYAREQLVGSPFPDYFTDAANARAGVRRTLDEGFVTNYELLLRSRHRREILVSFNASIFRDPEGDIRGIFAVARDVTEQRRLEEQLRESENYNRGLIESSVDALVTVDPDGVVTDVNEQMVNLTGYTREDLIGSSFKEYFTEPDRAIAGVRQTLAEGSVTNYELVLQSRSGRRTVVSFNAGTFQDTEGQIAGILAAARDITEQKRLEQELREQQAYNRSLIESSVDALMTVDPDGVITDVNEQTVRLMGFTRKQLIGSRFFSYFAEPDLAQAGVSLTFAQGVVTNYELVVRTKSGRKIPVSFNAAVFRDTVGTVAGILAAARDSTLQKRIEEELREQQTYTRGLIESNIDALMTTDTLGIITDVNRQMCAVTGREREDLIGTPFKNYFTDPRRAEDGIRRVLTEERVTNYELTIRAADGKETVVSYNATTFTGADGRLRGVFAAARDITDQKRLEEQIREQNRELMETTSFMNNVLESSTEYSIVAMDLEGQILAWNEGARRNYGYTAEEMVGRRKAQLLHVPEDVESGRVAAILQTAMSTGKAEGVFERVRKSGDRFTASVAITLRRDSTGVPIGYVLISKDITEQKQLEEQLQRKNEELEEQYRRVQEANRLKSEFLANMSHELRTPLNGIIGFAQLMHDGRVGPVSDEHKEYLGDILTSSRHLLQLINDVLDLAKVESGRMDFNPEPVQVDQIVAEVRDVLRTLAASKLIQIAVEVDPSVLSVVADPARLKQILYNYLSNALKFTPNEGSVAVRVVPQGPDWYRIEVQDSGIGIAAEEMNRLFVEFQQLDASIAKKYQGTGLGLALTKRMVEAQGGEVGVVSAPGNGSTFSAVLPRVMRRLDEENLARPPTPTSAVAGPNILVIDDNPTDREWLGRILGEAGYAVTYAATAAEAISHCQRRVFDAITLDLLLPDLPGSRVLQEIRTRTNNAETPVVVVTVIAQADLGLGFAIHDYLLKPVKSEELLAAIGRSGAQPNGSASILVIDDDQSVRDVLREVLADHGFDPVCVADGKAGLEAIKGKAPAAIVLDLLMPNMDGFEFLYALRRSPAGRRVPVIILTSKDLTTADRRQLQMSAQGIVLKGEEATERLLAEIKNWVPQRSTRAAGSAPKTAAPRRRAADAALKENGS